MAVDSDRQQSECIAETIINHDAARSAEYNPIVIEKHHALDPRQCRGIVVTELNTIVIDAIALDGTTLTREPDIAVRILKNAVDKTARQIEMLVQEPHLLRTRHSYGNDYK